MGANYSSQVTTVVNQTIVDMSTQVISENVASTTSTVNGSQLIRLAFIGSSVNCDLNVEQNATVKNKVYQAMSVTRADDMQKELQNELATSMTNSVSQMNKDLKSWTSQCF